MLRPTTFPRCTSAILLGVVLAAPLAAQSDTLSPRPLFTYRDAVLAGTVLVGARLVHPLDEYFARRLQDSSTQDSRKLQKLATFVRTTAAQGSWILGTTLYVAGRLSHSSDLADLGLHGTEALAVGELTAALLKGVVGRQRPSVSPRDPNSYALFRGFHASDDYRSFPSGHSVAAFAAAAAVTSEMSRWAPGTRWVIGPIMYGGAGLVGASRMYNNRHWASDVIVGAGIGTFAGLKVVRYQHSNPGNVLDRLFLTGSLVPTGDGGHAIHWSVMPDLRPRPGDR